MARSKRTGSTAPIPPNASRFPILPPVEPMLAKVAEALPDAAGEQWIFEPKWDGFRAIVFRDRDELYIQSRDLRPLDRYFPEVREALLANLPERCVIDGEIVVARGASLDFGALQLRLHPAASRVAKLSKELPASFVAFDVLALASRDASKEDLRGRPMSERRAMLEEILSGAQAPVHLTPATRDRTLADEWFRRFEGAGLDGVMAKHRDSIYEPGKRVMLKIKHVRSADCVVAGFRWHKGGEGARVGSLLLGLFGEDGVLHHVGVTSSFTMKERASLAVELAPLREDALRDHPWAEWARAMDEQRSAGQRMPGAASRWSADKDLSWEPLRIERVCEVKYDHLEGDRFRHAATFLRWRADKRPLECTYAQLEVTPPYELEHIFGAPDPGATSPPSR